MDMDENCDEDELWCGVIIDGVSSYKINHLSIYDRNIAFLVLCLLIFDFVAQPIIILTFWI